MFDIPTIPLQCCGYYECSLLTVQVGRLRLGWSDGEPQLGRTYFYILIYTHTGHRRMRYKKK
jgi:hypothetical protein